MSKARSLADLISGGAVIEASEIADSTITGAKLASDISITTTGTISTPSITGLSSLTIENVNIDNNSITSIASNIEQVSYTSVTTNIFTYSQTFNTGDWQALNSTVAVNNTTAPDGTTTANKITQNSGSTNVDLSNLRDVGLTSNSGTVYTISIHAKISANRNFLLINDHISSNSFKKTWFNLSNGTVGTNNSSHTATITDVGNGWYRCSITVTSTVTNTDSIIMFGPAETDGTHIITDNQGSLFLWGAQLEESATLTGYLTTTSASLSGLTGVTRGVSGTTAATASSGDTITIGSASTTLSVNITATQNYIPLSSLTGVAASGSAVIGNSNIDLNLSASGTGNVKLVNDEKLVFGDAGENISGDGTDLSINSSGILNINSSAATGPAVRLVTSAGGILLDSNSLIVLDADNADNGIQYKDGATEMLRIHNLSSDVILHTKVQDKDLIIKGNDGGSDVTALTFDMSSAGSALFNSTVSVGGLVVRGGHLTLPGQLAVTDVINANNGVALGVNDEIQFGDAGETISGDGTSLTITSSHNTVIDSANQIIFDAGNGANIYFRDDGTLIGQVLKSGNNDFKLKALQSGKDLVLEGLDSGGSLVQALTLDMSAAGAATFSDKIILGANKSIEFGDPGETVSGDGTNLTITSSQNLIIDAANELKLDSIAGINLFDNGSSYGLLSDATGDFVIKSQQSDKDIIIKGNDGGSTVNALTFDMSEAGNATFNADVTVAGNLTVNGTTTTLNTATLDIEDKTLCIAKGAANAAAADGAGIIVDGASACLTFTNLTNSWDFNENVIIQRPSNEATNLIVGNSTNNHEIAVCRSGSNPSFVRIQAHTSEPKIMFCTLGTTGGLRFSDPSDNVLMKLTTAGRLGIGTTSPGTALHIVGSGNPTLRIGSSTSTSGNAQIELIGKNSGVDASTATIWADYNGQLNLNSANNVEIRNGNTTSLRVVSNGNIGIGTSSPSSLLHLSSSDPQITITDTDGTGSQVIKAVTNDLTLDAVSSINLDADSGVITFKDGGTQFGSITKSGNDLRLVSSLSDGDLVFRGNDGGVGITALTLDMSEAGNATFNGDVTVENYLRIDNSGSEVLNIRGETTYGTLSVGNRTLNLLANATIFLDDEFNEVMRMHTNGYIGIGTSSPTSTVDIRGANGAVQSRGLLYLSNNDTYGINKGSQISFGGTYDSTNDTFFAAVAGRKENGTSGNYEGYLQFSTRQTSGNNERMRITSGGCVGIGHTNPVRNLSVFKSDYPTIQLVNSTSSTGSTDGAIIQLHNTDMDLVIRNQENADIRFDTNGANERMKILSNGKVGIGVGNAQRTLHVKSSAEIVSGLFESAASTNLIRIVDSNTTSESQAAAIGSAGDNMTLTTNGSERMRIDSSGNVGIGETAPLGKLHVKSADSGASVNSGHNQVIAENSGNSGMTILSGTSSNGAVLFGDSGNNAIGYINYTHNGDHLDFGVNNAERMRIDSSGRVLIGTTSTFGTNGTNSVINIALNTTNSTSSPFPNGIIFRKQNFQGNNAVALDVEDFAGNRKGSIQFNESGTSFNTSSDYRLKENVSYDFDATTRLKQLKPARFNFISDADTTVDGFLAHEVSSIVPEAISGEKDAVNEDGSIQPQGIDQSKLVPLLVKTIQELEARITQLENA